jgi:two-component system LytT family response regulator
MRLLIVDDEAPARDRLHRLLAQEADIAWIGHARDGIEALALVDSAKPDVVFLDVQMPELSGIDVAASLPSPAPLLVFATAYDEYAVRAFDADAIDYLLKPFDRERLQRTLARVRERLASRRVQAQPPEPGSQATRLPAALTDRGAGYLRQLLVSERGVTRVIPLEQIGWIETADNYVMLHPVNTGNTGNTVNTVNTVNTGNPGNPGKSATSSALLRQTLTGLLEGLGPAFIRCHRRAAVQVSMIEQLISLDKGDAVLLLHGGSRVPCSRQYRNAVMAAIRSAAAPGSLGAPGRASHQTII